MHRKGQSLGIGVATKTDFRNIEEVTVPKGVWLPIMGTARKPDVVDLGEEGEGGEYVERRGDIDGGGL